MADSSYKQIVKNVCSNGVIHQRGVSVPSGSRQQFVRNLAKMSQQTEDRFDLQIINVCVYG